MKAPIPQVAWPRVIHICLYKLSQRHSEYFKFLKMAQEWNDCILVKDDRFIDSHGRTLLCRGVNMSGCSKLPTGPGNAWHHKDPGFYNYRHVSFIGRPFKLHEVDDHFSRLHKWGLTFARLLVTWEALEHEGPGIYDEDYISYLLEVIRKAPAHGIKVFIGNELCVLLCGVMLTRSNLCRSSSRYLE